MSNVVVNPYRFAVADLGTSAGLSAGGNTAGGYITDVEVATDYVWATGTVLPVANGNSAYVGDKNNGMNCGGSGTNRLNYSVAWDGTAWSSDISLNTPKKDTACVAGTYNEILYSGGANTSGLSDTTEEYDGNTWTAGDTLAVATELPFGSGLLTSALVCGGLNGVRLDNVESYDGNSFTDEAVLLTAAYGANGAGISYDSIHVTGGGDRHDTSATYDGIAWTDATDYPIEDGHYMSGGGIIDDHICMGGYDNHSASRTDKVYVWDGISFTEKDSLAQIVYGTGGDASAK